MTTRKLLIEQVRRKLSGGNVPNNFPITELEVGKMVDQTTNAVIATQCLQGLWDDYITEYENMPIKFDERKNLYYTDLPAKVISLPNQLGVFQVSTMKDQSSIFIPTTVNSQWLYPNLVEILQGNSGYYNEQKKIYFVNYNPNDNTDTILLKLIVDRSEFDEEADYQIPPSIEEVIYATVLNKFAGK